MPAQVDFERMRREMVERQLAARGVASPVVPAAMGKVRREGHAPSCLGGFAYEDTPLPIEEEQTIPQPYSVASMIDALGLRGGERGFHDSGVDAFLLALREPRRRRLRRELTEPRLERAIGVIYRPETELASPCFHAVRPLATRERDGTAETFPFGS